MNCRHRHVQRIPPLVGRNDSQLDIKAGQSKQDIIGGIKLQEWQLVGFDDIQHCLPAFDIRGAADLFKHNGGNKHLVDAGRNNVEKEVARDLLPLAGLVLKKKADHGCVEVNTKPVHELKSSSEWILPLLAQPPRCSTLPLSKGNKGLAE